MPIYQVTIHIQLNISIETKMFVILYKKKKNNIMLLYYTYLHERIRDAIYFNVFSIIKY